MTMLLYHLTKSNGFENYNTEFYEKTPKIVICSFPMKMRRFYKHFTRFCKLGTRFRHTSLTMLNSTFEYCTTAYCQQIYEQLPTV